MKPKIITIDGPTASGKGTVAQRVAGKLAFTYLDSGALYRVVAYAAIENDTPLEENDILAIIPHIKLTFLEDQILLNGVDVSDEIRNEIIGNAASVIAVMPAVRGALLDWQKAQATPQGLVADGRDMGTVVFPEAPLKIFLTASSEVRAKRRFNQLKEKGLSVTMRDLQLQIEARDKRDMERVIAPLKPAVDAHIIDSSNLIADAVVDQIVDLWGKMQLK